MVLAILAISGVTTLAEMTPTYLRCEYLVNPLGVDAVQPRLGWELTADGRGVVQSAYQILAASSEVGLGMDEGDLWDSGKVASDQTAHVAYGGKAIEPGARVYWKVRVWDGDGNGSSWSESAFWQQGISEWKGKWIGKLEAPPADQHLESLPAAMLRKEFKLRGDIARATLSVSALGVYEVRINGQRIGDQVLSPEWTCYHHRVQYQTYDVTDEIADGGNAVGAHLGDGWYAGRIGISHIAGKDAPLRGLYGKHPHVLVQLDIEYADGRNETVVSDESWKCTTDGPIRKACILDGEVYDARMEMDGWDKAGFDDSGWQRVHAIEKVGIELDAQPNEPIRVTEELKAVVITEPSPDVYVADFGQNLAGWCRMKLNGEAGAVVRFRHAEVLEEDGNIYRDNLRMKPLAHINPGLGARQEDQFILSGKEEEIYEPHFTYHGFRYVEIAGLNEKPSLDAIVARVFHSDCPPAGTFECSSDLLNQLMKNIVWTHRDNMHGVPTDCPQRDERLGWMGDMLAFSQPACFNMDMAAFFTKWVKDIRDSQVEDGRYPDFAPHAYEPEVRFSGTPSWGDCGVVVPWRQYVNYGDTRMMAEHLDSMRRWIDWIHKNNPNLLWTEERGNDFGDWLNGDTLKLEQFGYPAEGAQVPKEVLATAFWQHSAEIFAKMAAAIGRKAEAKEYGKLADDIRVAFVKAYIKDDGTIEGHTQAGYALALHFDLVPENLREAAAKHMIQRIEDYKWHISTGFHTTVMLMNQLTRFGRTDVAYRLINNRTMPSWGYTIEHGGTTIWERWDGWVEGRGYQNPAMNSFNHYAIGAVGEWMYRTILGINPDETKPGYKHFAIRPIPGGGLTWAKGSYRSIRGKIVSAWKVDGDTLTLDVTVPPNTTATVYVPAKDLTAVKADGVEPLRMEDGAAVCEVGSGTYQFTSKGIDISQ